MQGTRVQGRVARVLEDFGTAHDLEEVAPVLVVVRQDGHPAVEGAERLAGLGQQAAVADLALVIEGAFPQMLDHQPGGHGLEHRHLDELALAGALAVHQRRQDREREGEAAGLVREDGRRIARDVVTRSLAHQVGDAEPRLDGIVVGGKLSVRTVGGEAVGAGVDDVGLYLADVLVVQPQSLDCLRAQRMDEGIGGCHDLEQRRTRILVLEVEAERSLVAIHIHVRRAHAGRLAGLADVTHRVAFGRLDLDDLGALIGEQHCSIRTEDDVRQIDDANSMQRAGHWGVSFIGVADVRCCRAALLQMASQEGL